VQVSAWAVPSNFAIYTFLEVTNGTITDREESNMYCHIKKQVLQVQHEPKRRNGISASQRKYLTCQILREVNMNAFP
jgi:hypothetical protein